MTKLGNATYNVELTCFTHALNETLTVAPHQLYFILDNDTGVLLVTDEGVTYQNSNGECIAFGERRNTAELIVGATMGVVMLLLGVGIGIFVWYRTRDTMSSLEQAPLTGVQ